MTVKKVLTIDRYKKFLETPSEPIKKITKDVRQLVQDIKDTIDANPAVGLAAPQIGLHRRVIGVRLGYQDDQEEKEMQPPIIMINPEIIDQSTEEERGFDACLSIPRYMGYTDRKVKIKVRYLDEEGNKIEREFDAWDARVIQHEIDHLDGILFLNRLKSYDDLFVYVTGEDGKRRQVPYNEVMKKASANATDPNNPGSADKSLKLPTVKLNPIHSDKS